MKATLFGRTKVQIVTNFAAGGIGLVLLARWAQQAIASADGVKHESSGPLPLSSPAVPLHDRYLSAEATDRAQYRLSLSMFKHVIRNLENSTPTAVESSF